MCAIVGVIFDKNPKETAPIGHELLRRHQHRGYDSAGMVGEREDKTYKEQIAPGTIDRIFADTQFLSEEWRAYLVLAHVRYSTSGVDFDDPLSIDQAQLAAQPFRGIFRGKKFYMSYNGNLTPSSCKDLYKKLYRDTLEDAWEERSAYVDTELIVKMIEFSKKELFEDAVIDVCTQLRGAFSLVFLYDGMLIALRDQKGFRPLEFGSHPNGYIIASEDGVFMDTKFPGIKKIRSIKPGECIVFEKKDTGITIRIKEWGKTSPEKYALCQFEFVYFRGIDSAEKGIPMAILRRALGKQLARECPPPPNADIILGVPDSGVDAAIGYAQECRIPYVQYGLRRDHNITRTFLKNSKLFRKKGAERKFFTIPKDVQDKIIVVIDDSIIRANVTARIVYLLKKSGAKEVHFRSSSPPARFGCWYGIDTYRIENELIAKDASTITEIKRRIDEQILLEHGCNYWLNSLDYLSLEGMENVWRDQGITEGLCNACWTGKYPVK